MVLFRVLTATCLALLMCISSAQAIEDSRFKIDLVFESSVAPSLKEQVEQALPTLWNRILTKDARQTIPQNMNAMSLLRGVSPQATGSSIIFNAPRVWAELQQRNIAHIEEVPAFHLQLAFVNKSGSSMQQTSAELLRYAEEQAPALGIQLSSNAPLLAIRTEWLDDSQVQLSVRGQSRLPEFSETHQVDMGDPFTSMQTWIIETLIKARDAYAWHAESNIPTDVSLATSTTEIILNIEKPANLSEQITLETALLNDPRIISIRPTYLNHNARQYQLQLQSNDDSWLGDWFTQRGMLATPSTEGWLIQ